MNQQLRDSMAPYQNELNVDRIRVENADVGFAVEWWRDGGEWNAEAWDTNTAHDISGFAAHMRMASGAKPGDFADYVALELARIAGHAPIPSDNHTPEAK